MSTQQTDDDIQPIACDLTAIPDEQRSDHAADAQTLFAAVSEIQELDQGYAFRLPADADTLVNAARFVSLERLCCPFFDFALAARSTDQSTWLELTGTPRVKQYIHDNIVKRVQPKADR